jgi:hypothetical protein
VAAAAATATAKAYAPATVAVSPAGTPPSQRPTNVQVPVVVGTPQVGQQVASSSGAWTGSPTKFAFRWQRCDANGLNCVAIAKATHGTYTPTPDDIGSTLEIAVTATGAGGSASAHSTSSAVVIAAPLPVLSIGSQTVVKGVAGNVGTIENRATATWQPGAVPVGLTVSLGDTDQALGLAGTGVTLGVPGLPSTGFKWPLEVDYMTPSAADTVLGYSTDGKVFAAVPALASPALASGQKLGAFLPVGGTAHVLTRTPLDLSFVAAGAWGDPTYTSPTGPGLTQQTHLRALVHASDRTVLVLTRLAVAEQTRLTATITSPTGGSVSILPKGSVFGSPLEAGRAPKSVQTERDRPGVIRVRLRLNDRRLAAGTYTLRVVAVDPWGRKDVVRFHFTLS